MDFSQCMVKSISNVFGNKIAMFFKNLSVYIWWKEGKDYRETINKAHNEFANSKEIDAKQVDSLSNSFMNFGKSYFVPYTTSNSRLHLSPVKQQIDQSMVRLLT